MGLWSSFTRRRSIPEAPAWVYAAVMLCFAAYTGWEAVRPEDPPVMQARDPAEVLQGSQQLIAHGEALMQAVRNNDQQEVERLKLELQARSQLKAERESQRTAAITNASTNARILFGLIAALSLALAAWLLVATRRSPSQSASAKTTEPGTDSAPAS